MKPTDSELYSLNAYATKRSGQGYRPLIVMRRCISLTAEDLELIDNHIPNFSRWVRTRLRAELQPERATHGAQRNREARST